MVGGNPKHDAYGFRYWNEPGSFAETHSTGSLRRFESFLTCLWSASFTIVGPEYVSMVAGGAKRPRIFLKTAFKTMYWRFGVFFIVGALCVGIIIRSNDPTLVKILKDDTSKASTGAASPYVIGMVNLGVKVLPDLINALLVTSIFSAGNTYCYCATRTLYGLALEGRAPAALLHCTNNGVPIYCVGVVMLFPLLSFLQASESSNKVLTWLVNLITAGGLIDYIVMSVTYIYFYRACKAQGLDRRTLPYVGRFQPYCAYVSLGLLSLILTFYGCSSFTPWNNKEFWTHYTTVFLALVLSAGWKLFKKSKVRKAETADLVWEKPRIDRYEESFTTPPMGFWREMIEHIRFRFTTPK